MTSALRPSWKTIAERVSQSQRIYLCFDLDGTLASIRRRPTLVTLAATTRRRLVQLRRHSRVRLMFVSGRGLADLKRVVGLKGVYYVGNHGLEIEGPDFSYVPASARRSRTRLLRLAAYLVCHLPPIPGAWMEEKGLTLSFHLREVRSTDRPALTRALWRLLNAAIKQGWVQLTRGRLVWEVRPAVDWDKGQAVRWLYQRLNDRNAKSPLIFYAGDDVTDEAAFRAVNQLRGISILAGRNRLMQHTAAAYRLRGPADVQVWLREILSALDKRRGKQKTQLVVTGGAA